MCLDNNHEIFVKTLKADCILYQNLEDAYNEYKNYSSKDENEFIYPYIQLYNSQKYESLSKEL